MKSESIAIVGMACLFPDASRDGGARSSAGQGVRPGAAHNGYWGLRGFWNTIAHGKDCIRAVPPSHWNPADYHDSDPRRADHTYSARGAFLSPLIFDPTDFGIPPAQLEATDTSQLLGVLVARAALADAGYADLGAGGARDFDREATSVILGVTGTLELVVPLGARLGHPIWKRALAEAGVPDEIAADVIARIADGYVPWQEASFPGLLGNVVAGRIANRLDLGGTNCVVDAACASSLSAIHLAALELASGRSRMVVTGGVDTFNDIFMFMCFSKTPALSPTGDARPFSTAADGTVLGEGLGMVVMKRLTDAQADGDRIYAVMKAMGTSSDGRSQSIYAPRYTGQARAMVEAYRAAGVDPRTIELIEAHGTGTAAGDLSEARALELAFIGEESNPANMSADAEAPQTPWCALGSVKSQIGHTKAAAGAAGLIKAVLALHHKVLPPTIKIDEPAATFSKPTSPFYVSCEPRPWLPSDDHPRRAGVSAFGFGGSNFHALLEEATSEREAPAWTKEIELVPFSAATSSDLRQRIEEWRDADRLEHDELGRRAAAARLAFDPNSPWRAAMVLETSSATAALVDSTLATLARVEHDSREAIGRAPIARAERRHAVGCGKAASPTEIAFLFPGQGSQYPGMGLDLACVFPEALDSFAEADRAFATHTGETTRLSSRIFPLPAYSSATRALQQAELTRTEYAQPALGAMALAARATLARFGVRPAFTAGHSYGELVALAAAGRLSIADLHRLSSLRGQLMAAGASESSADRGTMLAVSAERSRVEALLASAELGVALANHNHPRQVVLSGATEAIAAAALACKDAGLSSTPIPVSAAFHSELVADALDPFRAALVATEFVVANGVIAFSNTTGAAYPRDAIAARDLLAEHLVRPVDWVKEIEGLHAAGARTFIEVGPKAVLTSFVDSILGERDHLAIAIDRTRQSERRTLGSGLADLAACLCALAARGHALALEAWEAPVPAAREPRMKVVLTGANHRSPNQQPPRPPLKPIATPSSTAPTATSPATSPATPAAPHAASPAALQTTSLSAPRAASPASPASMLSTLPTAPRAASPAAPVATPLAVSTSAPLLEGAPLSEGASFESAPASPAAIRAVESGLAAMHSLIEQTARVHERFLEGQIEAQRSLERLITGSAPSHLFATRKTAPATTQVALPMASPAAPPAPPPVASHAATPAAAPAPATVAAVTTRSATAVAATAEPENAPLPSRSPLATTLLGVVAELTGYPPEMLDLQMDLEADLGIDSIKRVEILAVMQERVPGLAPASPEVLGSLRTLAQVLAHCTPAAPAIAPSPASAPAPALTTTHSASRAASTATPRAQAQARATAAAPAPASDLKDTLQSTLLGVVAELTGYPSEMLDMQMDLEADLGIDSIKRVEILAVMQERVPGLMPASPEVLGSLRTLAQVLAHCTPAAPATFAAPAAPAAPAAQAVSAQPRRAPDTSATQTSNPARGATRKRAYNDPRPTIALDRRVLVEVVLPVIRAAGRVGLNIAQHRPIWVAQDGSELAPHVVRALVASGLVASMVLLTAAAEAHALDLKSIGGLILLGSPRDQGDEICSDLAINDMERAFMMARGMEGALLFGANSGGAFLATVSRLDGAFGGDERIADDEEFDPFQGGLAGLARSAAREWPGVQCRVMDLDSRWRDPEAAAWAIVNELLHGASGEAALAGVGLADGRRTALELEARPAPELDESTRAALPIGAGDLVVVSGGARGVTAACVTRLAAETGATLLLLGRTELPQIEPTWLAAATTRSQIQATSLANEWAGERPTPRQLDRAVRAHLAAREIRTTLAAIAATGARARYAAVDVRDQAALNAVLASARAEFGTVRGIVHGAGVIEDRKIADKTKEQVRRVLGTKLDGITALLAATRDDDPAMIALFSSVAGRFGNQGQSDYAMANSALSTLALSLARQRPQSKVVAIEWGPWESGMVTPELRAELTRQGVGLIPMDAGADAFVRELAAPRDEVVVVIGDRLPFPEARELDTALVDASANGANGSHFDGEERGAHAIADAGSATSTATATATAVASAPATAPATATKSRAASTLHLADEITLSLAEHPVLDSHRINGKPVLPMAITMEWLAHAALHQNPGLHFAGLDDLRVLKGVVLEDESMNLRLLASRATRASEANGIAATWHADVALESISPTGKIIPHARARALLCEAAPGSPSALCAPRAPLACEPADLARSPYPLDVERSYCEALFHGPHFRAIKSILGYSSRGIVADLCAAPPPSAWMNAPVRAAWLGDPLAIDAVFQLGILFTHAELGAPSLPAAIESLRIYAPFPASGVRAAFQITAQSENKITADVHLLDSEGRVVAALIGFQATASSTLRWHHA